MKEEKKFEMFLLTPAISNSPHVKSDNVGTLMLSIPTEDMINFEDGNELDEFLFSHYSDWFFNQDIENTTMRFEFFMDKIKENEEINESE